MATERGVSCDSGRNACIGVFSSTPLSFTSPTTPITSRHGLVSSGQPCFSRLPIASSPGHNLRASDSLITVTRALVAESLESKVRPRTTRIPIVSM